MPIWPGIVDRDDRGMVQSGDGSGFSVEALKLLGIGGDVSGQKLERDDPVQVRVMRPIHFSRATGPDESRDFVGAQARSPSHSLQIGDGRCGRLLDERSHETPPASALLRLRRSHGNGVDDEIDNQVCIDIPQHEVAVPESVFKFRG